MKCVLEPAKRAWDGIRYRLRETRWTRPTRVRSDLDHNVHYLYVEIFWAAIFTAVFAFNATYALRLGATNQMVGWLSSLPALFAVFMMVPTARFLESRTRQVPWLIAALTLGRFGFLLAAFVPWIAPEHAAEVVVALFVARTLPITFFNTGFSPLMAEVIPERDRSRVFANRNIILSATTAGATFLAGKWLDAALRWEWAAFPLNYQLLYIVGGITALLSVLYVAKIRAPQGRKVHPARGAAFSRLTLPRLREAGRTMLRERREFSYLIANTLIFNLGAWMVAPLYTIFFVRELAATDSWIGLNSTFANLGVIGGYALWRRWITRLGDNRALRLSVPLAASYAFLVALFPNLNLILVWGVLINLINAGVNLSHTNVFYRICPEERRVSYMALYSSIMNAGAFICPMIGVAISEVLDIRWVLVIGGVVRLLGGLMFYVWRIEDRPATVQVQPSTG